MKSRTFSQRQIRYLRERAQEQYENMRGSRLYRNVDFLLYMLVIVMSALAIRSFIAEPIRVDGDSMVPTLLHNEDMIVEKVSLWVSRPQRGEIVICYYPGYTESCVKRVIGLPGETVSIVNGAIYIDGAALDESDYWQGEIIGDMEPLSVPARAVFVVGDNRNGSKDSRNPSVGCIPYAKVEGRVLGVIWPFARYRLFTMAEPARGALSAAADFAISEATRYA